MFGATVFAVKSSYDAAYDLCTKACQEFGWYNRNCAINPVLVEGKKTAGLEVAEQCRELRRRARLGGGERRRRLHDRRHLEGPAANARAGRDRSAAAAVGRAGGEVKPIEYAMEHDELPPPGDGKTIADSIDVHVPRNWRKAVHAIRESNGVLVTASDEAILDAMRLAGRHGVFAEPAAAAALAGVVAAIDSKTIGPQRSRAGDDHRQRTEGHARTRSAPAASRSRSNRTSQRLKKH